MKKKILVYDNQLGYYNLLKDSFKKGYTFLLYGKEYNVYSKNEDAIVFFLDDNIELLDLIKLYREDIPFIIGCSHTDAHCLNDKENIYNVSLMQTKDSIIMQLSKLLENITNNNLKEEAL